MFSRAPYGSVTAASPGPGGGHALPPPRRGLGALPQLVEPAPDGGPHARAGALPARGLWRPRAARVRPDAPRGRAADEPAAGGGRAAAGEARAPAEPPRADVRRTPRAPAAIRGGSARARAGSSRRT